MSSNVFHLCRWRESNPRRPPKEGVGGLTDALDRAATAPLAWLLHTESTLLNTGLEKFGGGWIKSSFLLPNFWPSRGEGRGIFTFWGGGGNPPNSPNGHHVCEQPLIGKPYRFSSAPLPSGPIRPWLFLRMMLTEAYVSNEDLIGHYGKVDEDGVGDVSHLPCNFGLISALQEDCTPKAVAKNIRDYLDAIGNAWPNFNMGNHDQKRIGSRMGQDVSSCNLMTCRGGHRWRYHCPPK